MTNQICITNLPSTTNDDFIFNFRQKSINPCNTVSIYYIYVQISLTANFYLVPFL